MKKIKTVLIHRQYSVYVPYPQKSIKAPIKLLSELS